MLVNEPHQNTEGEMKRKMIALALCSLMSAYACCGCNPAGNESKNQQTSSTQTSDAATAGIPEDVRAKLQAALDAPPIELPTDEWTEETVKDAIYISGEKLKEPLTLRDFGEGLEVRNDETLTIMENANLINAALTYYGVNIASCAVKDCTSLDDIYDCPLLYISFYNSKEDLVELSELTHPIAINGVSMGSNLYKAEERLIFMTKDEIVNKESNNIHYAFTYESSSTDLVYTIIDDVVIGITLRFN